MLLINAVKDVAHALGDLISATKNASGKSVHDPAMTNLKESAKVTDNIFTEPWHVLEYKGPPEQPEAKQTLADPAC